MRVRTPAPARMSRSFSRPACNNHLYFAHRASMQRLQFDLLTDAISSQLIEEILGCFNPGAAEVEQYVADDDAGCFGGASRRHSDNQQRAISAISFVGGRNVDRLDCYTDEAARSTGRQNLTR